jgi:hypothetical protein
MVNEELNNTSRILRYWNNQDIVKHRTLTDGIKQSIRKALKNYTIGDIELAIYNYGIILNSDDYFFKYRWTLQDFLSRHNGNNIERFLDLEVAKQNFKKNIKPVVNKYTVGEYQSKAIH